MNTHMTIGAMARLTAISEKTIRFYEESGILPPAGRTESGYRLYTSGDVRRLRLIRRARSLGISLRDIKELVHLAFGSSCLSFEHRLMQLIDLRLDDVEREVQALDRQRQSLLSLRETLADTDESLHACKADECECCRFIDR